MLVERCLESLGLWQGLVAHVLELLYSHFRIVQRLTSVQGSMHLPAGFSDSAFFVIQTWSFPHPRSLHFKSSYFSAFHIMKLCCLQTSESWAETGSPIFLPQVPHASKCAHLLGESMMWRRIPKLWPFPLLHRLPMVSSHPIRQVLKVKSNSVQYAVCRGIKEKESHRKWWVFSFNNANLSNTNEWLNCIILKIW